MLWEVEFAGMPGRFVTDHLTLIEQLKVTDNGMEFIANPAMKANTSPSFASVVLTSNRSMVGIISRPAAEQGESLRFLTTRTTPAIAGTAKLR